MANKELLENLAAKRNVATGFVNYLGEEKTLSGRNIEQVLSAMGHDVNSDACLRQDCRRLDLDRWTRMLPPVVVLNPMREWMVPLYIAEQSAQAGTGRWLLQLENSNEEIEGGFCASGLDQGGSNRIEGRDYVCLKLPMSRNLPLGYHRLTVKLGPFEASTFLIVAPAQAFQPEGLKRGRKIWGTGIQLYTLRSERNWGMGDFGDLIPLIESMASQGADIVGINPIHALYPISPEHASPYSPSNRNFLNPLYIAIDRVDELKQAGALRERIAGGEFQDRLDRLRRTDYVDYSLVSKLKYEALRQLYACFCETHLGKHTARGKAFDRFVRVQGKPLFEQALFEALLEYFDKLGSGNWGWPKWPAAFRDRHSPEVKAFADNNGNLINFYLYLQFVADEQLQAVFQFSKQMGMEIGLYRDLAVGPDRGGAETWINRENFCLQASIGAPPDELAHQGQNWDLPPLDPVKCEEEGYRTFINLLRNNMQACGALRIDHAMALLRLWWCPLGKAADQGAYVYYDFFDMLGILNLESQRNRCMVIAEDLGTVPPEVVEYFPKADYYSNRVFYFEVNPDWYRLPEDYAAKAMSVVSNHDLPTVAEFWQKSDLAIRYELKQFNTFDDYQAACRHRELEKRAILSVLENHGLLPDGLEVSLSESCEMNLELCLAMHKYLAISSSLIMTIQLEDLMLIDKPVNIPGTVDEYPNWRRKLTESSEQAFSREEVKRFCREINSCRDRQDTNLKRVCG